MANAIVQRSEISKQLNGKCGSCKVKVKKNDKALQCNLCDMWHHIICEDISEEVYSFLTENEESSLHWYCRKCEIVAGKVLQSIASLANRQDDLEKKVNNLEHDTSEKVKKFEEEVTDLRMELNNRPDISDIDHVLHEIANVNMKVQEIQGESNKLGEKIVKLEQGEKPLNLESDAPSDTRNMAESSSKNVQETVSEVVKEMEERKLRENNIVIFGAQEKDSRVSQERTQHDLDYVNQILVTCGIEAAESKIKSIRRLGQYDANRRKRPIHIVFTEGEVKIKLFRNIGSLKSNPLYNNMSITNDLTKKQREQEQKLLTEAKNLTEAGRGLFKVRGPPWARKIIQVKRRDQEEQNTV